MIPTAYRFSKCERMLKDILRHRVGLVQYQTSVKNRIHGILHKHNIKIKATDIFGKGGRELLSETKLWGVPRILRTYSEKIIKS